MPHLMHAIKKWKLHSYRQRGEREKAERLKEEERERERDKCAFNLKRIYLRSRLHSQTDQSAECRVQRGKLPPNRSFLSV